MEFKIQSILLILLASLLSCDELGTEINSESNWKSSGQLKFDNETKIVNDEVKLIYCSSAEDPNPNNDYLIQFIGVRIKTGDTINILTDHSDQIGKHEGDKIFILNRRKISDFNIQPNKDLIPVQKVLDEMTSKESNNGLNSPFIKSDIKFINLEENNFKWIIGEISRTSVLKL